LNEETASLVFGGMNNYIVNYLLNAGTVSALAKIVLTEKRFTFDRRSRSKGIRTSGGLTERYETGMKRKGMVWFEKSQMADVIM